MAWFHAQSVMYRMDFPLYKRHLYGVQIGNYQSYDQKDANHTGKIIIFANTKHK